MSLFRPREDGERPRTRGVGKRAEGGILPRMQTSESRTAYPQLRGALSSHLRDVGDFVALSQPDEAREALQFALSIRAEIEIPPDDRD
jgi:hypothetical protein